MKKRHWKKIVSDVVTKTLALTDLALCGNGARTEFLNKVILRNQIVQLTLCDSEGEEARLVYFPPSGNSLQKLELWFEIDPRKFAGAYKEKELSSKWKTTLQNDYRDRIGRIFQILTRFGNLNELSRITKQ